MERIIESVDVSAPVDRVYEQWTRFEEFPQFMEHIEHVERLGDRTIRWRASVDGKTEEWVSEITAKTTARRIAWQSVEGARNAGEVTFEDLGDGITRVTLQMEYDPEGLVENIGTALGFMDRSVHNDLESFREMIEDQSPDAGRMQDRIEHTKP
jgi:uncharacterized membrane protein